MILLCKTLQLSPLCGLWAYCRTFSMGLARRLDLSHISLLFYHCERSPVLLNENIVGWTAVLNLPGTTDCKQTLSPTETYSEEEKKEKGEGKNDLFPLHVCPVYVERPLQTQLTSGKEKQDDWAWAKPQTAGDQVLDLRCTGKWVGYIYLTAGPRWA